MATLLDTLDDRRDERLAVTARYSVLGTSAVAFAFTLAAGLLLPRQSFVAAGMVASVLGHAPALFFTMRERPVLGLQLALVGDVLALTTVLVWSSWEAAAGLYPEPWAPVGLAYSFVALAYLVLGADRARPVAVVSLVPLVLLSVLDVQWMKVGLLDALMAGGVHLGFLAAQVAAFEVQQSYEKTDREDLVNHLEELGELEQHARAISTGDLSGQVSGGSELLELVLDMKQGLRRLVSEVVEVQAEASQASNLLTEVATSHASGAVEQSAAISETRATVSIVVESARTISDTAEQLRSTSAKAHEVATGLADGVVVLLEQTRRIEALLTEVRGIAEKTDLLALNAALEGVRAGETGRGFTLVAGQMQELADRVRETVGDLTQLNQQIAEASQSTRQDLQLALEAAEGSRSSAAQIAELATDQQRAILQVDASMGEIGQVTGEIKHGSSRIESAAGGLASAMERLRDVSHRFRI